MDIPHDFALHSLPAVSLPEVAAKLAGSESTGLRVVIYQQSMVWNEKDDPEMQQQGESLLFTPGCYGARSELCYWTSVGPADLCW